MKPRMIGFHFLPRDAMNSNTTILCAQKGGGLAGHANEDWGEKKTEESKITTRVRTRTCKEEEEEEEEDMKVNEDDGITLTKTKTRKR
ncbi:hypothetical protein E2C01_075253 [Portunus trituberculatus]|uniref:Uncharacterized protein n=1 Tax=Portunus trituberculatus TaxID=210409 RepID=A0A5B7IGL5_PORTR|nr:hypothetical protein [Portunus trituberculatus]